MLRVPWNRGMGRSLSGSLTLKLQSTVRVLPDSFKLSEFSPKGLIFHSYGPETTLSHYRPPTSVAVHGMAVCLSSKARCEISLHSKMPLDLTESGPIGTSTP